MNSSNLSISSFSLNLVIIALEGIELDNPFKFFWWHHRFLINWTLSQRRSLSYRNQSMVLLCKSVDFFQYGRDLRHERVKLLLDNSEHTWKGTLLPRFFEDRPYWNAVVITVSLMVAFRSMFMFDGHRPPGYCRSTFRDINLNPLYDKKRWKQ